MPQKLAIELAGILQLPVAARTAEQKAKLLEWYRTTDPDWQKLDQAVQKHLQHAPRPELTKVLISSEGLPAVRLHTQGADFFQTTYHLNVAIPTKSKARPRWIICKS